MKPTPDYADSPWRWDDIVIAAAVVASLALPAIVARL